jgi:peptide/nickel transport system permease protein
MATDPQMVELPVRAIEASSPRLAVPRASTILAAVALAALIILAIGAPLFAAHGPNTQSLLERLKPPAWSKGGSWTHPLGTDTLGRDIFARLLYGARVSFGIGLGAATAAGIFGTAAGLVAGYRGGLVGGIVRRAVDVQTAFPFLVIALTVVAVVGATPISLIITIGFWTWVPFARLATARTMVLAQTDYVRAAEAMGSSHGRVMWRHLLPNIVASQVVLWTFVVALAIIAESALSFLGVGLPPPTASWGSMINEGRTYLQSAWWISVCPAVTIVIAILCLNVLGNRFSSDGDQNG